MEVMMTAAARRATNLTLNSRLIEEAKTLDINLSRAAEQGIRNQIAAEKARKFSAEFPDVVRSNNEYIDKHGLPLRKYRSF
jgi:antitoxin CcdA